jgi:hypothetical protein
MRVIAFACWYHYLNWFSKGSIIRWHEVRRPRAATILAIWAIGGLIYRYDFRAGFAVFYVPSMLHLLLEFPLNHQTFVAIGRALRPKASLLHTEPIEFNKQHMETAAAQAGR